MNSKSLNLIEEVITSFGMWDSLEIAQDSIYLEFSVVENGDTAGGCFKSGKN